MHTESYMFKSFRSPKTIIKISAKGGKGFFASENILADEIIAIRAGHIVNTDKAIELDKELGDFSLQITDEFFIFLGISTCLSNWISILLMIIPVMLGYLNRIKIEEKFMANHMGQKYLDYKSRTKRLIPAIY